MTPLPPFGDPHPAQRICMRSLGFNDDGSERLCGEPAFLHVGWEDRDPMQPGWACSGHAGEIDSFKPFQVHEIGDDCGMPGSLWFVDRNQCGYPEGPASQPTRAKEITHA